MKAELKFINRSNDSKNSDVVIFQKPTNPDWDMETIAWKVIKNCGRNDYHPFEYDYNLQVSSSDSWGNYTPHINVDPGTLVGMVKDHSGDVLKTIGIATNPKQIQLINKLDQGTIDACCYRSGSLLAIKKNVVPESEAIFEFQPQIYVGVISDIEEGDAMNSAIVKAVNTEFSLLGVKSASIVMYGGGIGPDSTAYHFELEDVVNM